uniref:Uncharacterized protein n=1 Tax=Arundo donax TaxID=35708 RepID=A0A0A9AUV4_ARUDO
MHLCFRSAWDPCPNAILVTLAELQRKCALGNYFTSTVILAFCSAM